MSSSKKGKLKLMKAPDRTTKMAIKGFSFDSCTNHEGYKVMEVPGNPNDSILYTYGVRLNNASEDKELWMCMASESCRGRSTSSDFHNLSSESTMTVYTFPFSPSKDIFYGHGEAAGSCSTAQ